MSDASSFRSSPQTIRTRCRTYRQTPVHLPFYPIHRQIGSRHAATLLSHGHSDPTCDLAADNDSVRRRVRIELTTAHQFGETVKPSLPIQTKLRPQLGQRDALDLSPGARDAACVSASSLHLRGSEPVDSFQQIRNPTMLVRNCQDNRWFPVLRTSLGEGNHRPQFSYQRLRTVAITFVDHEDVANFKDAGLGRLDSIAHPRREQNKGGVSGLCDLNLRLADPNR